jgi:hypothetical protein
VVLIQQLEYLVLLIIGESQVVLVLQIVEVDYLVQVALAVVKQPL